MGVPDSRDLPPPDGLRLEWKRRESGPAACCWEQERAKAGPSSNPPALSRKQEYSTSRALKRREWFFHAGAPLFLPVLFHVFITSH